MRKRDLACVRNVKQGLGRKDSTWYPSVRLLPELQWYQQLTY